MPVGEVVDMVVAITLTMVVCDTNVAVNTVVEYSGCSWVKYVDVVLSITTSVEIREPI